MAISFNIRAWLTAILLAGGFSLSCLMQTYQDWHYFPALGLLSAALLVTLSRPQITLPNSGPAFCILLFWALYALMFALSTIPFLSQIAFLIFCALPLGFITITLWGTAQKELLPPLAVMAALVFGVLAGCAVYKNIFIPTGTYGARAHWPFINPNSLATVLAVGLIPLTGLALGCEGRRRKIALALAALLVLAGLIGTESRGGLLGAGTGLGVMLWFCRDQWSLRRHAPGLGAGVLIAALMPLIAGSHFWGRVGAVLDTTSPSFIDRVSLWRSSWKMMLADPWTGTGPGTFSSYYPAFREALRDQSGGYFAHFDALQMGVEMGVAAPILFYTLLTLILIRTIRAMLAVPKGDRLRLRIMTPFAALLAVAIHAHICFPLYIMPVLLGCGILLGFWHQATGAALGGGVLSFFPRGFSRAGIVLGGVLVCGAFLALAGSSALGSYYMKKSLHQDNPKAYLEMLARAEHYGPESFIDPEIELARINLRLLESGEIASTRLQQQYLDETAALLDTASLWNPQWAEIDYLRAKFYAAQSRKSDAIAAWKNALTKNPMHFESRRALAEYLDANGQGAAAISVVTTGLTYPHNLTYRAWAKNFLQKDRTP